MKGFYPRMSDRQLLFVMRGAIVGFARSVLVVALNTESSIFGMVENAYKVTLAGAFVPLFFGAFWKRATTQGALFSTIAGLGSWLLIEFTTGAESLVPPQLIGLFVSAAGMIAGSLLPQWTGRPSHAPALHGPHAAAQTHHVAHDGEQHRKH